MKKISRERKQLLHRVEDLFEGPLVILGFIWLVLLIIELIWETNRLIETLGVVIWVIFILDFIIKFILAPDKTDYLRNNVLTAISLLIPAFRILRVARLLRFLRVSRSLRLVKVISGINRSMRALSQTMKRRAFGYVFLLTVIVIFAGAAGMYAFEKEVPGGLNDYGTSLWWTTMIMTTLGSEYWPHTPEGRVLCVFLALYAFAVFGYITATIATYFIGRDSESATETSREEHLAEIRRELAEIRQLLTK